METIPKITIRKDDALAYVRLLRNAQAFDTHGALFARRTLTGLGEYRPFDEVEFDEIFTAQYIVYSYDTPIAWLTRQGEWVKNQMFYSTTTRRHQSKVFEAIDHISRR